MAQIEFSEEQIMLAETAVEFCRNKSAMATVRAAIDADETHDAQVWQEMSELGWSAIAIPEAYGGLGMGVSSVVPILEAMGHRLMGTPLLATTVAVEAITANASEEQKQTWLPQIAEGAIATVAVTEADGSWLLDQIDATATKQDGQLVLSGAKLFVLDAQIAQFVVVSIILDGEPRLVVLRSSDLSDAALRREVMIDQTRRSYTLLLDDISVSADRLLPGTDFAAIQRAALLLICAEMAGGLTGVLEVIVEYLSTRKQFERLIGSYQSLKHPAADILLANEAAKSHVYHAATLLEQGATEAATNALSMAKAQGSEAFSYAGDRAVQFHGGFGFTYECDAQLYLRRALWCQHQFGDERYHRQLLAPQLLDGETA